MINSTINLTTLNMSVYTTFATKPRIIEAEDIYINIMRDDSIVVAFRLPKDHDCAYRTSINARNFLVKMKEPENKFFITFSERKCLDAGNAHPSFTSTRGPYVLERNHVKLEVSPEVIEKYVSSYSNADKRFKRNRALLHLVMRWNEVVSDSGFTSIRFELKCTHLEN